MSNKEFSTIENIVAAILMEIGDENNKRYYTKAFQWAIDEYRRLYVHRAPFYTEKKLQLDSDRYYADYPPGMVQMLAVGTYRGGVFAPFTKEPNLSLYPVDAEDDIYQAGDNEGGSIPDKGYSFASKTKNIGYWAMDPDTCRIYVRNYRWDLINQNYTNNTENLTGKIIARYKTTGVDCWESICIPYEFRELVIALVNYRFMLKNIPVRTTVSIRQEVREQIEVKESEFYELTQGVHNIWEVKDAIYSSLNTTARR